MHRPRIAIPGRFTESASALRYRGVVSARALVELVWAAGGDPVTLLPVADADGTDWADRLRGFDGVLLPGGGDVNPRRYGQPDDHESLYDLDPVQDEVDFTLAQYALDTGTPLLAICRGLHVLNVILGGTLVIDMPDNHRHHVHSVRLDDADGLLGFEVDEVTASCYHHQAIDRLADGLVELGRSDDDIIEAVAVKGSSWVAGLQWHPEDTYQRDAQQLQPFRRLVAEAAKHETS